MFNFLFLLTLLFTASVYATDYEWADSSSSCGASFSQCFDNADDTDTIYLMTNGPITTGVYSQEKAVSIIAGDGYNPVFSEGRGLTMATSSDLTIQGLTFLSGHISINNLESSESNTLINIISNTVNTVGSGSSISVSHRDDMNLLTINMKYNNVTHNLNGNVAMSVSSYGSGSYDLNGFIYGNTLNVIDPESIGISVSASNLGTFNVDVIGNEIHGASRAAIAVNNYIEASNVNVNIISNALLSSKGTQTGGVALLSTVDLPGSTYVNIYNNSILNGSNGIKVDSRSLESRLEFSLVNNLVLNNDIGVNIINSNNILVTQNDTNIFYGNSSYENFPPLSGTNLLLPNNTQIVKGLNNPRLVADSPAIDTATFVSSFPFVDADGLHRSKLGGLDIGAFEYGDVLFSYSSDIGSFFSQINNESINGDSSIDSLHLTSNININGNSLFNYENPGIYYSSFGNKWNVFNQGLNNFINRVKFNIIKIADSANTFEHTSTGDIFSFSYIDRIGLNSEPNKILQVTQNWAGIYNPHPVGVYYGDFANKWYIYNFDGQILPNGANFNVQYQDESKSAWQHVANEQNSEGSYSYINHPMLNGNKCAQLQVTQSASQDVFNDKPIGVYYNSATEQWAVRIQSDGDSGTTETMPFGAAFHILINPEQTSFCNDIIFASSFNDNLNTDS